MKKIIFLSLFLPTLLFAEVLGLFHPAKRIPKGNTGWGGYFQWIDANKEDVLNFVGQVRYGYTTDLEFGAKLGLSRWSNGGGSETGIYIGVDGNYGLLARSKNTPVNLSIDGFFGISSVGDRDVWAIGTTGILDGKLGLEGGKVLIPYGGFTICICHESWNKHDDTELELALTGGIMIPISPALNVVVELLIADDIGFGFGLSGF